MEKLSRILHDLEQGNINIELAKQQVLDLFAVSGSAIDVIKWMADCPYYIDQATVPKNGIDVAPKQVVGNMSLGYLKYKQLRDVAEHYR